MRTINRYIRNCAQNEKKFKEIKREMDGSEELKRKEWIFEENTMEIQTLTVSEIYVLNEYLVEIARITNGKEYYVKVYELVASGAPYGDPQTALKAAIRFLEAHPVR